MNNSIIQDITRSPLRRSLFHFTRTRNLQAICALDALYAADVIAPQYAGGIHREELQLAEYEGKKILLNAHLRIKPELMDPDTSVQEFHACLDRHVFLWLTERDCLTMAAMYARREPEETFAILQFAAYELMQEHYEAVRLSKYDSGSSPRYPHRVAYHKSCRMLLPLSQFKHRLESLVPVKASEIKEVLIEHRLAPISRYLQTLYCSDPERVPEAWRTIARPMTELRRYRDKLVAILHLIGDFYLFWRK
ncbi:DUF7002 family protein [Paenibacillus donghaensis]|uniref:DUF4433 domain-containing protein n=1 Tax=Paenibacillus donghaensis TaxID=414771 RepID=A0A2Z2KEH0_9BACL|nr:hypothetical protein [Paenibacillus donghaensis]ASA21483.1 hypothetical protein B9T62_12255 [Paenibacillus donghaensis]